MRDRSEVDAGPVYLDTVVLGTFEGAEPLRAKDVMQCGVVSIDVAEPVKDAVITLIERNISGLPVTRDGRLVGMLSEKDLLRLLYETEYLPGVVEDYMTQSVVSFDLETDLVTIHQHLVERHFRRLPILLEDRLAGIITRADLIRAYKERFCPPNVTPEPAGKQELLAEDAMKCGLLTVRPDALLYEAMDLIVRHHVTGLPVVDDGMHLLGVITEKDLLDCVDQSDAVGASVEAYMTEDVVTFDRKASLLRICACLIENDFHRVPIVDNGRLVGIVGRSDILKHRAAIFAL